MPFWKIIHINAQWKMSNCQLYKYNRDFYALKKETSAYFSQEFIESELDNDHVAWLNYHGVEPREEIEHLCRKLNIDKLSVENVYHPIRRPKVEEYPNYLFFSVKSVLPSQDEDELLDVDKIHFLLGKNYLISFQEHSSDHFTDVRDRIVKKRGKIRMKGSDFLLFRLMEAIVDNYFEVLEEITEKTEKLEQEIRKYTDDTILQEIEAEKRKLIELRKTVVPMRDITVQLENIDGGFIEESNRTYFHHLKSSCLSVLEEIDSMKLVLDGITNIFYAAQGQRMNEIMRVLTVVSSIFIPLTFIVGVYGMNFKYMPELEYPNGYYTVIGAMVILSVLLLLFFIKRGWLRGLKKN